jgi:hypothetical protein
MPSHRRGTQLDHAIMLNKDILMMFVRMPTGMISAMIASVKRSRKPKFPKLIVPKKSAGQ